MKLGVMCLSEEEKNVPERRTIVYKCVSCKERKLKFPTPTETEKCLEDVRHSVLHIQKGKQYEMETAIWNSEQEVRRMAIISHTSQAFVMIPHYMSKRLTRIRVKDLPGHCDPARTLAILEGHGEIVEGNSPQQRDWNSYGIPDTSFSRGNKSHT
ncbi:Hypothetical predicted protein [Octopus vulgaris]|uniref:Uncharacterized protein n=1 Tax=Octopus vulgaris TaxID=6645 RepID=A0AA36AXH3_OCTVU|nr:Hypothetical predicted protein [Octopus vulgaris]